MNRLAVYMTLIIIVILFSCNSQKRIIGKYKSQNKGNTFYLILNGDNKGELYHTNEYRKKNHDSIRWNFNNKEKVVFVNKPELDTLNEVLLPKILLYGGKNLLMRTDSAYFLFYKIKTSFEKQERDFYLYQLKTSGYENRFIKKHFGDSLEILNKFNTVKSPAPVGL